jgi:hypothetical protein
VDTTDQAVAGGVCRRCAFGFVESPPRQRFRGLGIRAAGLNERRFCIPGLQRERALDDLEGTEDVN